MVKQFPIGIGATISACEIILLSKIAGVTRLDVIISDVIENRLNVTHAIDNFWTK